MLFLPLLAPFQSSEIQIHDGLAIGGVAVGGRVPVVRDAIVAKLVRGETLNPQEGDKVQTPSGREATWQKVTAGADGTFQGQALQGSGYVFATVESSVAQTRLLEASGHTLVYVNGVPRTGDPYGYGYLKLPVKLNAGRNTFLFSVGRGSLRARLTEPVAPIQIETGDPTLPDVIPGDKGKLFGAVVVLNNTGADAKGLVMVAGSGSGASRTRLPTIPAMSLRKVRFDFRVGSADVPLTLISGARTLHKSQVTVRLRKAGEEYRRTFVSGVDGSVQYYAVQPSTEPKRSNALILTLHGASVEAQGQADAYTPKPWATLVAATNRRPYGFDWEDWGRLDALEVLDQAKKAFPHDPKRVVLTGHSMGGHGTWSLGTLFPSKFAATAPSAGWVSFWSYAGGWKPSEPTKMESLFFRAMSPSDTLARIDNLKAEKVYILHGDADDNVPVDQARTMSAKLRELGIPFSYHEEAGAGHWWGNQCVDYPDLMATLQLATISDFKEIDFTTPDPNVSGDAGWITLLQQEKPREMSRIWGKGVVLSTGNVRSLQVNRTTPSLELDGVTFRNVPSGATFVRYNGAWKSMKVPATARRTGFSGPLKEAFRNRFVLVYGTTGRPNENAWSRNKAIFDAETFYYRGNGAVDIVSDKEFLKTKFPGRNAILYGNAATNAAFECVSGAPISLLWDKVGVMGSSYRGEDVGATFVYPSGGRLVGVIGGTGPVGMRMMDRLPVFTSGTAYPDWAIYGPDCLEKGTKGILGAGFWGPDWEFSRGNTVWDLE